MARRKELTVEDYYHGILERDIAIFPRALTLVESTLEHHQRLAEQLLTRLLPHTGKSIRVGITGPPGAGKSTFIEALGLLLVGQGRRVAVLAIDPASQISGGSILGDKTRMKNLSMQRNAFIRPSTSAGTLGGIGRNTRQVLLVCEAAGFDVLLVETVGIGQSESLVMEMTDCFLALMLPGSGDELQGMKRGLLELVDVIAVNKADGINRQAAELAASQLESGLSNLFAMRARVPQVLMCSALHNEGIHDVWDAVSRCYEERRETGVLCQRRQQQSKHWMWRIVEERIISAIRSDATFSQKLHELEHDVISGVIAPEHAARCVLSAFGFEIGGYSRG